jgi:hypothetical protein
VPAESDIPERCEVNAALTAFVPRKYLCEEKISLQLKGFLSRTCPNIGLRVLQLPACFRKPPIASFALWRGMTESAPGG